MWIYFAILLTILFLLLYKYSTRKFDYWKNRNVFYLKPVPFLGNMLNLITKEPLGLSLLKMCNGVGSRDFFGIFIFDRPTLIVTSPKLVKVILQKDFSTFSNRTITSNSKHPVMSNLLFVQRNAAWKDARAKLSPIFTSGKLKLMFPLMIKEGVEMTDYISTIANVPDVESKEICAKFSTNVITRCAFAVEANSFKNHDAVFRKLGRQMFDFRITTALRQMGSFFAPNITEWLNITFIDLKIVDSLQGIFNDVLHSRKASPHLKGNDFVDILLEAHGINGEKSFSKEAMLGQAIQFFAAGFETVAETLSFTLYELCVNPDIQEKLRKEINEFLERNKFSITYEVLPEMKYLDMCISETLRKYPPVAFLDRMCTENYKLEDSEVIIEKGTPVYIPTYALHYNPKYFPNPEKYDPDRFINKSSINKNGIWYLPFGDGPRNCIGLRFGLMEAKIGIISILSKYRLEKSYKTPLPIQYEIKTLILQSKVGIPLKFVPL